MSINREIKFRAWDKQFKTMLKVEALNFAENIVIWNESDSCKSKDNVELMQYTGLKDKNCVEIYEGDVVRWGMDGVECYVRVAKVELSPCLQFKILHYIDEKTNSIKRSDGHVFGYSNFIYKDTEKYLEVIGNIYENKELLDD